MNNVSLSQLNGIIELMRETEKIVKEDRNNALENDKDVLAATYQYETLKQAFLRQLLAGLLDSRFSTRELEPFLKKAIGWLINYNHSPDPLPDELVESLKEVEQMFEGRKLPSPQEVKEIMAKRIREEALREHQMA